MPDGIVIVDEQGTRHKFPVGMDPKQAAQIVRNANLKAANERPLKEPTDYWGGFRKGGDDYATEVGQGMFESAAHPKTAGDFLGLMLPTSMGTAGPNVLKGLKSVGETEPIGNRAVRGAARVGAEALDLTPNIIQSKAEEKVIKGLRDFSKKPEPRWLDRNLPNKSGVPTSANPIQTDRVPITGDGVSHPLISEEDRYMPNRGGVPDHGVPTGELPRPTEVDHHLPNESGYVPGSASRDTTLKVGEGPKADPHMPNKSGYTGPSGSRDTTLRVGEGPTADPHMPNRSGYQPGSASRDTTLKVGAGPTSDAHMPNRSGYTPGSASDATTLRVPDDPLVVDHHMPNASSVPDRGVPTEELPTSLAAELETPQETLIRRAQHPTSTPPSGPPTPYGGVEVPHKVKKPRMGMEVANPFGPDEAVHEELLKRLGGQGGEEAAVEGARAVAKPMLKADEVAEAGRRLYGSRDAGRMLRPNDPKGGAEAIKRMAPGPSRIPLTAEARINGIPQEQTLEDALKQIILSRSNLPPE